MRRERRGGHQRSELAWGWAAEIMAVLLLCAGLCSGCFTRNLRQIEVAVDDSYELTAYRAAVLATYTDDCLDIHNPRFAGSRLVIGFLENGDANVSARFCPGPVLYHEDEGPFCFLEYESGTNQDGRGQEWAGGFDIPSGLNYGLVYECIHEKSDRERRFAERTFLGVTFVPRPDRFPLRKQRVRMLLGGWTGDTGPSRQDAEESHGWYGSIVLSPRLRSTEESDDLSGLYALSLEHDSADGTKASVIWRHGWFDGPTVAVGYQWMRWGNGLTITYTHTFRKGRWHGPPTITGGPR